MIVSLRVLTKLLNILNLSDKLVSYSPAFDKSVSSNSLTLLSVSLSIRASSSCTSSILLLILVVKALNSSLKLSEKLSTFAFKASIVVLKSKELLFIASDILLLKYFRWSKLSLRIFCKSSPSEYNLELTLPRFEETVDSKFIIFEVVSFMECSIVARA